jgi:hypothetical protein
MNKRDSERNPGPAFQAVTLENKIPICRVRAIGFGRLIEIKDFGFRSDHIQTMRGWHEYPLRPRGYRVSCAYEAFFN